MIRQLLVAAALATSVPAAVAAQTVSTVAADPAALAKARELMAVMHVGELIEKSLDAQTGVITKGLADRLMQSGIAPQDAANDPEFRQIMQRYFDRLSAEITVKMKAILPQIVEQNTLIYARNFSAAQLNDLVVFYNTPTGQAMLAKMPSLSADAAAVTRDLTMGPTMDVMKSLMPQMTAELQAWSEKHKASKGTKQ